MGFFKNLLKTFSSEKYRRHPEGSALTPEQFSAINVGAINAEQTMSLCDALTTGNDVEKLKEQLRDYYGIEDAESAMATVKWFIGGGHRIAYDFIREHVASDGAVALDLSEVDESMHETVNEYVKNLNETTEYLIHEGWITNKADLNTLGIEGWDLGRCVLVVRSAYDCGYISEEDAWQVIKVAHDFARTVFPDWHALAKSYVVGRAMWGGDDLMLRGINNMAKGLLEDEGSPWKAVPLQIGEPVVMDESSEATADR